jgi:hypothetical protein
VTAAIGDPSPSRLTLFGIMLSLLAMALVTGAGLWWSDVLTQPLWSDQLELQTAMLLLLAAVATAVCILGVPVGSLRGWPGLATIAAMCSVAICGTGVLATGLIAACCFIAGHAVFLAAGVRGRVDPVFCAVVGLGVLMLLLVAAGLSHVPMLPAFWLVLIASAALLLSQKLRAQIRASLPHPATPIAPWGVARTACAALIMFALLFYMAQAALPERFWDPLAMHLLIPTQVAVFGHWGYDPTQFAVAFFPLGADYLFAFAYALGGEAAAKLINVLALLAILLLLADIVRSCCGTKYVELGTLLLLSMPVTLLCTASTMVENVLCLLVLAAVRALLLMEEMPQRLPLIALCVLLPAMAAVKLHGAVAAVPCTAIALMRLHYRNLSRTDWVAVAVVALVAGVLGLSQYANAWYSTGNPVFPMMNELFRSPLWPATAFEDARWQGHLTWDLLYQMTFHSGAFMECYPGAIGFAFMALLLPGIGTTVVVPKSAPVICLAVAAVYLAVVLPQVQYIRYMYPVMPLLLVPCTHGLAVLGTQEWCRRVGGTIAAAVAILGMFVLPSGAWTLKEADLRAAYDPVARHAMLQEQVPTRLATETVNAISTGLPRVIYGGEPYGAFLRGTPIYTNWYNRTLQSALLDAADINAVTAVLDQQRPDFVVAQPTSTDPTERRIADYAERRGRRVATIGTVTLWQIAPLH